MKCSQYWPLGADFGYEDDMFFPECGLKVSLKGEQSFANFTVRTLEMTHIEVSIKTKEWLPHMYPSYDILDGLSALAHIQKRISNQEEKKKQ